MMGAPIAARYGLVQGSGERLLKRCERILKKCPPILKRCAQIQKIDVPIRSSRGNALKMQVYVLKLGEICT